MAASAFRAFFLSASVLLIVAYLYTHPTPPHGAWISSTTTYCYLASPEVTTPILFQEQLRKLYNLHTRYGMQAAFCPKTTPIALRTIAVLHYWNVLGLEGLGSLSLSMLPY